MLQGGQLHPPLLKSLQLIDGLFDPDELLQRAPSGDLDFFLFAPAPIIEPIPIIVFVVQNLPWNFSGMIYFDGSVGFWATIKVWASMAIRRTASCHSYTVESSKMLV